MSTQARTLEQAIELIDDTYDMASYETCAAAMLHHAVAEQNPGGDIGEVHDPKGEYASLLAFVCAANALPSQANPLTSLHEGLWYLMNEGWTAREAARDLFRTARDTANQRDLVALT